jgi:hypothetical protein
MDRIELIRKVRQQLMGMEPKKVVMEEKIMENPCWEGHEPYGTKILDGKEVPNCVPMKSKKVKEGFPIPSPSSDEDENRFISRCASKLNDEYPDEAQRLAICYKAWEER